MIRCVGAALRGDGNPPEVPVAVLAERLCEEKYSELYPPEGALIKDGLRPSVSAPFLRQRIYTLIRRKV